MALVPEVVSRLTLSGLEIIIQQGAGVSAGFVDDDYRTEGAKIVESRDELFLSADIVCQVHGPGANPENGNSDIDLMHAGQVILGLSNPLGAPDTMMVLAGKQITSFALDMLPRISRAQPMDMLTSMATIIGYKGVLLALESLPKMVPMMMTAAGTVTPARVLVVGAGVAGLQAIATARRLGAVVQSYDVRPVVKEQVESLGAKFVELELDIEDTEESGGYARVMGEEFYRRQSEMMMGIVAANDIVITTAAIPGRIAPILIREEMVRGMSPGSVIVDLVAENGGNCELTKPGKTIEVHSVTIAGPINLASSIPYHASQMYARNFTAFFDILVTDGKLNLDISDPIIQDTLITHQGEVVNVNVKKIVNHSLDTQLDQEGNDG